METNLDLRKRLLSVEKEIKKLVGKEPMNFYLCVVINVLKSVKSDGAAFLME